MSRIPIVLIAGFLGAGKTTFLRALMEALKERRIGFSVVVNDFENAEIDATRLRSLDVEVQAINGSCVCCSSLNDFMLTLGTIDVPRGGVLLVEANAHLISSPSSPPSPCVASADASPRPCRWP